MMYLAVIVAVTLLSAASSTKTGSKTSGSKTSGSKIAFKAVLDSGKTINANEIVVYTYVTINEGNGYNPSTGIFTVPRSGLYVFLIHAMSYGNTHANLRLYKNNVLISTINITNGKSYINIGDSTIVRLNKGDNVFVKTARTSPLWSYTTDHYTSFSGFLI